MRRWTTLRGIAAIVLAIALLTACSSGTNKDGAASATPEQTASAEPAVSDLVGGDAKEAADDESAATGSKGFLWRVNGGANPAYLVGTIHVARESMYPLDPDLEQAAAEADYIGLELDLTTLDQMKVAKLVSEKALLTDGTTLKDHVSQEDYEKFQAHMKKAMGIVGASMFDKFEPWYGAMTLESLPAQKYMKTDGIDMHLAKEAHEHGKTVIELESMESQIGLFDGFSDELQQLYFHQTVEGADKAAIGYKQLLDMWTLGDLNVLKKMHEAYVKEGKASMGDMFDEYDGEFLSNRNGGMVEKIDGYLREGDPGTYLFAVGSLHMVGEHGLVAELEKRGYRIEFID